MDLNAAIASAEAGAAVRDDRNMAVDWVIKFDPKEKLLYYFRPNGERAHRVSFTDEHRASYAWRIVDERK